MRGHGVETDVGVRQKLELRTKRNAARDIWYNPATKALAGKTLSYLQTKRSIGSRYQYDKRVSSTFLAKSFIQLLMRYGREAAPAAQRAAGFSAPWNQIDCRCNRLAHAGQAWRPRALQCRTEGRPPPEVSASPQPYLQQDSLPAGLYESILDSSSPIKRPLA